VSPDGSSRFAAYSSPVRRNRLKSHVRFSPDPFLQVRVSKRTIELVCQLSLGAMQRFTSRCRRFFVLDLNMQIF
jgi:hypothetical protein